MVNYIFSFNIIPIIDYRLQPSKTIKLVLFVEFTFDSFKTRLNIIN